MTDDLDAIRRLVGEVTAEQLRYVDSFVGELTPGGRELLPLLRQFMVEADNRLAGRSGMLRISGRVEEVDDRDKRRQLIDERDDLKGLSAADPAFKLMRLAHGRARFWTLADNMRERDLPVIEV